MMLSATRTVAPAATPISVSEVKAHLRIDTTDDDTYVGTLIAVAVSYLDGQDGIMGRCLVTQTWRSDYADFTSLRLPLWPLASVTSVTYVDANGAAQTVAAPNYEVARDAAGYFILPVDGFSWPQTAKRNAPVSVTAVYGTAAGDVPSAIKQAMLLMIGDWYEHRNQAVALSTSQMPLSVPVSALLAPFRRVLA